MQQYICTECKSNFENPIVDKECFLKEIGSQFIEYTLISPCCKADIEEAKHCEKCGKFEIEDELSCFRIYEDIAENKKTSKKIYLCNVCENEIIKNIKYDMFSKFLSYKPDKLENDFWINWVLNNKSDFFKTNLIRDNWMKKLEALSPDCNCDMIGFIKEHLEEYIDFYFN